MSHAIHCDCDQCLLGQMAAGDPIVRQRGWEAWYRRDAPFLLTFLQRRCHTLGCPDHSEDILQDCFLIGFRSVTSGAYTDQGRGLSAYLTGIAKNVLREIGRAQRRAPLALSEEEASSDCGLSTSLSAEDRLYLDEVVTLIREAYAHRPAMYQRVVTGIYVEGKSSSQLAAELGKNAGNVRIMAHRAVCEIAFHVERRHRMHLSAETIRACLAVL